MYRLTPAAIDDVKQIFHRTKIDFGPKQADKYYRSLFEAFRLLDKNPGIGIKYDWIRKGICGYPMQSHYIFYRVKKNDVVIVRILHRRRDYEQHLK